MLNLLEEPLVTASNHEEHRGAYTLPGVLAGLVCGAVASFTSLRSHQRSAWHAFLVQVAVLALEKAGEHALPDREDAWRALLADLTPEWPGGEPWSLVVTDPTKPALLQAPVPEGDLGQFRAIETPDALDILVTSKNHDVKAQRMWHAAPEDWLFALLSLQTQEGVMGAGKYGISRMNGGYGSRPHIGIDMADNSGFRFRRDVAILRASPSQAGSSNGLNPEGLSLLWLKSWNGSDSIDFKDLHPLYIEICRRVRLELRNGHILAFSAPSKVARIAGAAQRQGNTGEPWTPVSSEGKAFSVTKEGFSYRRLSEILSPAKYTLPALARRAGNDPSDGSVLVAQAICRGQGKTEGYHERRIPLPRADHSLGASAFAEVLGRRTSALAEVRTALRFALFVMVQGAPDRIAPEKESAKKLVETLLGQFDAAIDDRFFRDLLAEVESDEEDGRQLYAEWLAGLVKQAANLLSSAPHWLPVPSASRYRSRIQAQLAFRARLAKSPKYFPSVNGCSQNEAINALN